MVIHALVKESEGGVKSSNSNDAERKAFFDLYIAKGYQGYEFAPNGDPLLITEFNSTAQKIIMAPKLGAN